MDKLIEGMLMMVLHHMMMGHKLISDMFVLKLPCSIRSAVPMCTKWTKIIKLFESKKHLRLRNVNEIDCRTLIGADPVG